MIAFDDNYNNAHCIMSNTITKQIIVITFVEYVTVYNIFIMVWRNLYFILSPEK